MATFKSFEEIECWRKARELAKDVFSLTQQDYFSRDFELKNQINKSCGSVMDNIAEEFERGGNKEFAQFLYIAKGSYGEVRSQLYRAFDRKHIQQVVFDKLYTDCITLSKMIGGLINYLSSSELKGYKYMSEPGELYNPKNLKL
jgi:four helix bundle protein